MDFDKIQWKKVFGQTSDNYNTWFRRTVQEATRTTQKPNEHTRKKSKKTFRIKEREVQYLYVKSYCSFEMTQTLKAMMIAEENQEGYGYYVAYQVFSKFVSHM